MSNQAEESFINLTINKNVPETIPEIYIDDNVVHLPNLLTVNNITKSNSEARRIITSGGFKINDIKYLDLDISSDELIGNTLQIGKRKFLRINKK
jgi:tyrosyl-tRNA synthetase